MEIALIEKCFSFFNKNKGTIEFLSKTEKSTSLIFNNVVSSECYNYHGVLIS